MPAPRSKAEPATSGFDPAGSETRYRAIFETAVDAIVIMDDVGRICLFNPAAERLFGYEAADMTGRNVRVLMPSPYRESHDDFLARYRQTGERKIVGGGRAVSGRRKDGSTFPLDLSVAEWAADGRRFFTGMMRDATERARAEELQRLLVNELNHRVKNTLATVQSIALQTLRNARSPEAALRDLSERLLALATAHDLLTRESWEGADLGDIVSAAVEAHGALNRVSVVGGQVRLEPKAAVAVAMVLNELFTNAEKYGALGSAGGDVAIDWSEGEPGALGSLNIVWVERGGPPVQTPTRRGFGFRLIEGLARDLHGTVGLDFRPEGLVCVIDAHAPAEADLGEANGARRTA